MRTVRLILISLCGTFALAGCSYQQNLDAMVSPARQGEIVRTAELLCSNLDVLLAQMEATDRARYTASVRANIQHRCPTEPGITWRITNYETRISEVAGFVGSPIETATVVAGDTDGPWTEFGLNWVKVGDAAPAFARFDIERLTTRPESLVAVEEWTTSLYVGLALFGLIAMVPVIIIIWIIRRRRRRRQMAGG